MKGKKIITIMFLILNLSFSLLIGNASGSDMSKAEYKFVNLISEVFSNNNNYKVIKPDGIDYTDYFINSMLEEYNLKQYMIIQEFFIQNEFILEESTNDINYMERAITNRMQKKYSTFTTFKDYRNDSFAKYIEYSVSVTATCDNNGKILSYSNAYVSIIPTSFSWQMKNVSCYVTNRGNYITVNTSFVPVWDFVYQGAGISQYVAPKISKIFDWSPMY